MSVVNENDIPKAWPPPRLNVKENEFKANSLGIHS